MLEGNNERNFSACITLSLRFRLLSTSIKAQSMIMSCRNLDDAVSNKEQIFSLVPHICDPMMPFRFLEIVVLLLCVPCALVHKTSQNGERLLFILSGKKASAYDKGVKNRVPIRSAVHKPQVKPSQLLFLPFSHCHSKSNGWVSFIWVQVCDSQRPTASQLDN